ncbi:hypothetical protein Vretimale_11867 [Volvox reticuliferus]|uniref:SM/Sec1-family protein n=1 Tax=Volvox reticuliferus TaxID=1737510 RepID=A0A8J4FMK0_9CHLO|nr:hypothetical protein Vretifemale_11454 [Volvox reticuliferus]GIM07852.1 hypothetical protein Vretimale_11867 [Volvox reticuliferus]
MESCRKAVKERILSDMLGSVVDSAGSGWKVLILDEFTTLVLSCTLRMSDILDCNVSVVEDLAKKREPLQQAAVYFIQPSPQSISRLLEDFGGLTGTSGLGKSIKQLYPSVHIFFSNKVPSEGLEKLKANPRLVKSLKTLKELNLEFLTVDSRTMVTDHPEAGRLLLGGAGDSSQSTMKKQLDAIVSRLATLFTSLKEFPVVRYKAAQPSQPGDPAGQAVRASLPQLLATRLWDRLSGLQRAGQLPNKETCDLLVLDRSYDAVAPFIHEWSYEAIAYDLLHIEGNVYRYEVESQGSGKAEPREALLGESDDLWVELRHMFIADVYTTLHDRFKDFQNKNKAVKAAGLGKGADSMSATSIRQLIIALPQYREVLGRLALHIQLSSELRTATNARGLTDVGELEQDIVLGEKKSKDVLAFLTEHQSQMDPSDKVRLLACYLATHPGKLDYTKRQQWQKTAGLTGEDMAALCEGLGRLGVRVMDSAMPSEGSKSFFGGKKKNAIRATRKKRGGEDEYALNRFQPLLHDIVVDMAAGRMSADEYPYVRAPSSESESESAKLVASARTARSGLNWARRNQDGAGGSASGASGRRLVVFIIGGATRGEMRVAHQLAQQLDRDVILGSTSVDVPNTFVDLLYSIAPMKGSS